MTPRRAALLDAAGIRLILAYADTVPHLEALSLVWEGGRQQWTVPDIAARMYLPEDRALRVVRDLEAKGLLVQTEPGHFTAAADPARRDTIARITQLYRDNLSRVATLLHAGPSRALREFSQAFRIKGED